MKLSLEEQEMFLRCDRENDTAICVIPAQGFGLWLSLFKRAVKLANIQERKIFSGDNLVAYEYKFPKVWLRTPKVPRNGRCNTEKGNNG